MIEILLFLILLVMLFGAGAVVTGLWWLFGIALAFALIAGAIALTRGLFRFFFESWKNILETIEELRDSIRKIFAYLAQNPRVFVNVIIFPYPLAFWIYRRISPFDGKVDALIHGSIGIIGWVMLSSIWFFSIIGIVFAGGEALGLFAFRGPSHR